MSNTRRIIFTALALAVFWTLALRVYWGYCAFLYDMEIPVNVHSGRLEPLFVLGRDWVFVFGLRIPLIATCALLPTAFLE